MRWSKVAALAAIVLGIALVAMLFTLPAFQNSDKTKDYLPLIKNISLGLDLQGGVHVVLEAKDTEDVKVTQDAMSRLKAIIQNRVDQLGVAEPVIQQQGERRLIVELAGIKDPEEAVNTMVKTAYLEFKTENGEVVVTGKDLKDAKEATGPTGQAEVNLQFNSEGAEKFAAATTTNVGKPIMIYLDGVLIQSPNVKEPILNGEAQISPYESLEAAHEIAMLLRSGALPVKVEVVEKRTVGPALGSDSLAKSKHAGLVGIMAIFIFMLMYYRIPGLIANVALIVYALIVAAIYMGLNVVMTLPSIAAFLLSLGIAVDANVIIFERIREELRGGKSLRAGIDAGFKRGFVAVFDSNLTTVIAAIVLLFFGTGMIKGFAVTLIIGICASMFTAISMTRWLLHLFASANIVKNTKYFGA